MSIVRKLTELCSHPDGLSRSEIIALSGVKSTVVDACINRLCSQRRMHRRRVNGQWTRYFHSAQAADAWVSRQTPPPSVDQQIMAVYERDPSAGYSGRAMANFCTFIREEVVLSLMRRMCDAGTLFAVKKCTGHVYFTTPEAAAEYERAAAKAKAEYKRPSRAKPATPLTAARARSGIPMQPKVDTREIIIPAHVKVQRVGAIVFGDSRYQVQPGEKPFGAGFSMVGIGRDIQTGMGWAA